MEELNLNIIAHHPGSNAISQIHSINNSIDNKERMYEVSNYQPLRKPSHSHWFISHHFLLCTKQSTFERQHDIQAYTVIITTYSMLVDRVVL